MRIVPENTLYKHLLHIEKPGRYVGGEFGNKKPYGPEIEIVVALCFPDLYEIGMSNNAIRILYDLCNSIPHVLCDLVFSPAPDFEKLLKEKDIPLYTLEHGIPLNECDVIGFSVGYELAATNMLSVLECGRVPIHAEERSENDPIVIAGGPAITNPVPFGKWLDGVYVGDSENGLPSILTSFIEQVSENNSRSDRLSILEEHTAVWSRNNPHAVVSINTDFGNIAEDREQYFVAPNISIVQEHGVVEIMRGCPNGCRFCHAGEYYRPYRQKDIPTIIDEVEKNIKNFGYREITLSSLSTGDYPHLDKLINGLNRRHGDDHISFSLPSLKVNSFTLPVLKSVSEVRRSGLTFAIETPEHAWQMALNKEVLIDDIITIIGQAKALGWKLAKFYFMTGLPFTDREKEPEAITEFLSRIYRSTKIKMNINIGTFVPKPHTPFQWVEQLEPQYAHEHLKGIKSMLIKEIPGVKVSFHESFTSFIEGVISRGDERVGDLLEEAYAKGARLDAWDEHFNRDIWKDVIYNASWDVVTETCSPKDLESPLPWDTIRAGGGKGFLKKEYQLASESRLTPICEPDCDHNCGICIPKQDIGVRDAGIANEQFIDDYSPETDTANVRYIHIIATYKKSGKAIYYSHINMMKIFERMFLRLSIPIEFTHGFNPKPRLEFASPLPMGISGKEEVMLFRLPESYLKDLDIESFIRECSESLPVGIDFISLGEKGLGHKSVSAAYGGSQYRFTAENAEDHEKLKQMITLVDEAYSHVSIDSINTDSIEVSITEEKGKSGNILKLLDEHMPKYDFLSCYLSERIQLYGKSDKENLKSYLLKSIR